MRVWASLAVSFAIVSAVPAGAAEAIDAKIVVHADKPGAKIDRNIYGHFVEHLGRGVYEGIWVGEDSPIPNTRGIRKDVVAALKQLNPPVVRWPGGCFADSYHWRDGIGPRDKRPASINGSWGNVPESNAFGTHEFMDFAEQIGARPFVSINVGSGTVQEADSWMQYMTAPADSPPGRERAKNGHPEPWNVSYVGVGNETWGCGGNMYADTYADEFRKYAAFVRNWSGPRGQLIAVGADTDEYAWTETMMKRAMLFRPEPSPMAYNVDRPLMSMLSLHFYSFAGTWQKKGAAIGFGEDGWKAGLSRAYKMDELIRKHGAIMDRYDPEKKVGLAVDEWGTWWDGTKGASTLYQENTLRDAVIAGMTLNIFHDHADRVRMANIAQTINVLQAMVLTKGEKMIVTPTWHVFEMYKVHQDATRLPVDVTAPAYGDLPSLSVSASRDTTGVVHVSIVNLDPTKPARIDLSGLEGKVTQSRMLTAETTDAHPAFDKADPFVPVALKTIKAKGKALWLEVPSKSVTVLTVQ